MVTEGLGARVECCCTHETATSSHCADCDRCLCGEWNVTEYGKMCPSCVRGIRAFMSEKLGTNLGELDKEDLKTLNPVVYAQALDFITLVTPKIPLCPSQSVGIKCGLPRCHRGAHMRNQIRDGRVLMTYSWPNN